eukprot:g38003.t1
MNIAPAPAPAGFWKTWERVEKKAPAEDMQLTRVSAGLFLEELRRVRCCSNCFGNGDFKVLTFFCHVHLSPENLLRSWCNVGRPTTAPGRMKRRRAYPKCTPCEILDKKWCRESDRFLWQYEFKFTDGRTEWLFESDVTVKKEEFSKILEAYEMLERARLASVRQLAN